MNINVKHHDAPVSDKNLKSDSMAMGNPADTNKLIWESEISCAAEQPLKGTRNVSWEIQNLRQSWTLNS